MTMNEIDATYGGDAGNWDDGKASSPACRYSLVLHPEAVLMTQKGD